MIDSKETEFTPYNQPNVIQNPMLTHKVTSVSAIEKHEGLNLVKDVNQLRISMSFDKEKILERNIFPGCALSCKKCGDHPNGSDELKMGIQKMIDQNFIQFDIPLDNVPLNNSVAIIPYDNQQTVNMVYGCPGQYQVFDINLVRADFVQMHATLCRGGNFARHITMNLVEFVVETHEVVP